MFSPFDNNLITTIWTNAGTYFAQFAPIVMLVVGVLLGFWIIRILVGIFSYSLNKEKKHIFMEPANYAREYENDDETYDDIDFDDDDE